MRQQNVISIGQDSFLDVIANLVGIMVILVVIVGAHAKQSWVSSETDTESLARIEKLEAEITEANDAAKSLASDNKQLEASIQTEARFGEALERERHQKLMHLELVRSKIREKRSQLADDEARTFDRKVALASLEAELNELKQTHAAASFEANTAPKSVNKAIDHYPTPIAKTVFSDEIHFRLAGGKIKFVPMDELIRLMKSEWKLKAKKLANAPITTETVGPIADFRMQYVLESVREFRSTEVGEIAHDLVRLQRFVMIPVRQNLGENPEDAFRAGSDFLQKLEMSTPGKTTVSIWVYPDSFGQFNEFKLWLRENNFQIATWPISQGAPISGGPNGFRSNAQ